MKSVFEKLVRGGAWNSVSQFGSQALNLIITLILARRLSPADFGLFGMVAIITNFIGYFSEFGLTAGLIQKKEIDHVDTNSVFWATLSFSLLLYGVIFVGAPLVTDFYQQPGLTRLIRVLFLSFVVVPFGFVPGTLERKRLEYRKIAAAELSSVLVSGAVAVALSYRGYGAWCLVWQSVVHNAAMAVALVLLTGWRPKAEFSWLRMKPLLRTGVALTAGNLLRFAFNNTDYLLVGKLLGRQPLGFYTMAFRLSNYPILKLESIFGNMLFPAFSSFKDEPERVHRGFLRLLTFFFKWVVPVILYGYFMAGPLIHILLGPKWYSTVPLVRVLMISLVFSTLSVQNEPLMVALNRISTWNRAKLAATLALAIGGFISIHYLAVLGMAIAYTTVTAIFLTGTFFMVTRAIDIKIQTVYLAIRAVLLKNVLLAILFVGSDYLVGQLTTSDWLHLAPSTLLLVVWIFVVNKPNYENLLRFVPRKRTDEEA